METRRIYNFYKGKWAKFCSWTIKNAYSKVIVAEVLNKVRMPQPREGAMSKIEAQETILNVFVDTLNKITFSALKDVNNQDDIKQKLYLEVDKTLKLWSIEIWASFFYLIFYHVVTSLYNKKITIVENILVFLVGTRQIFTILFTCGISRFIKYGTTINDDARLTRISNYMSKCVYLIKAARENTDQVTDQLLEKLNETIYSTKGIYADDNDEIQENKIIDVNAEYLRKKVLTIITENIMNESLIDKILPETFTLDIDTKQSIVLLRSITDEIDEEQKNVTYSPLILHN